MATRNQGCPELFRGPRKIFGGDPSSPPPPTSPSTTFSFLSFLHGILVWYFAQKPEIFCQKNDWPFPPQKNNCPSPQNNSGPPNCPLCSPLWATLLATTFFRLFNGLVVTVMLLWVSWSLSYSR